MNAPQYSYFKEDFTFGPSFKKTVTAVLTNESIAYECKSPKSTQKINLDDVVGARVIQIATDNGTEYVCIHIYAYPLKKVRFSTTARRKRVECVFGVSGRESSAENLEIAERWVRCIKWLLVKDSDKHLVTKQEGLCVLIF